MNNDVQDKQFLALELTKIAYPPRLETSGARLEEIYKAYEYFLKQTTEITDEIETVIALKSEVERLQKENERLKTDNQAVLKPLITDITTIANGCRGDMEPYVYEALLSNCKRYEK